MAVLEKKRVKPSAAVATRALTASLTKIASASMSSTFSDFTREAGDYVAKVVSRIVLIERMIDHNVGVTPVTSYETKKIDSDYFIEG